MTTNAAPAVTLPPIAALAALTGIGPLALSIVVPSMPSLQGTFGVDYATAQLTITAYLLATALGQLVIGPVSDAFGRRPVLLAGLTVYFIGSLVGVFAWSIDVLIFARFVQALGGCAGIVLGRAIVRDVYGRDRSASAIAYVTTAMILAPMFAPSIGGLLDSQFGWRGSYGLLLAVGAGALLVAVTQVHETKLSGRLAPTAAALLGSFAALLRMPAFSAYAVALSTSSGMFFTFLSGGTFIIIDLLGHTPAEYGIAFISISIAYMGATLFSARFATRLGANVLIAAGCLLGVLGTACLVIVVMLGALDIWTLFGCVSLLALSNGLVLPSATATLISLRPDLAGAAAGLGGAIQFGIGALGTIISAMFSGASALPLAIILLGLALLSGAAFVATRGLPLPRID